MSGGNHQHLVENQLGNYGSYNDATGEFLAGLDLVAGGTATLSGILNFDGVSLSWLDMSFAGTANAMLNAADGDRLWFTPGIQCCSGSSNPPNSINSTAGLLTIWGANGFNHDAYEQNPGIANPWNGSRPTTIGLDLRVHLVQVPEPATLPIMGLGLIGFTMRRGNLQA